MILFSSLVSAIQGAVEQAVHAVSRENINNLVEFFHPLEESSASSTDESESVQEQQELGVSQIEKMTPRTVQLEYPRMTSEGPVNHFVAVPLITLAPVPSLQIEDVQVEMDLEIIEDNGEVMVGFPQKNDATAPSKGQIQPNASIKINIKANQRPHGVTALVEGYNKALRAQLPN